MNLKSAFDDGFCQVMMFDHFNHARGVPAEFRGPEFRGQTGVPGEFPGVPGTVYLIATIGMYWRGSPGSPGQGSPGQASKIARF